jgi:hypothetical protein
MNGLGSSLLNYLFPHMFQPDFNTQLSPEEEEKFLQWKAINAPHDSGEDYDLRGAYRAGLTKDIKSGHWPDTYKKPNHPTFSNQSIYSKYAPEKAGSWKGEQYIPPKPSYGDWK